MSGTKRACRMMLGLTLASLVASAAWAQDKPAQALTPSRQVAVTESGALAPGAFGAGRAPQKVRPFEGLCHTYVQFRLPDLPKGQAVVRGVLRLHADYVSPHPPSAWAAVTSGALPENLTWDNQPGIIELTQSAAVAVKEPGPFALEVKESLRSGAEVTLRVSAGGGGLRWLWWRADKTPTLEIWTGPEDSVISVMAASRDLPFPPDREMPSLLPAWRQLRTVPIVQYFWPKTDEKTRGVWLDDYLEMGFTGTYKSDQDPPHGGRLFVEKGLHGFMLQSSFVNRGEPVLDPDGKPAPFPVLERLGTRHPFCNSIFSPRNVEAYYAYLIRFGRDYGLANLFRVGETVVMSSWDETGLYSRKKMEYGYTAKDEFAAYLRDMAFRDASPNADTNGDGRTFSAETGMALERWADVPLPRIEARFEQPGLWRHFCDFHGYYTYRFFRRGSLVLSKAFRRDAELFTFSHATAKWPGRSSHCGLDLFWQSKLNRILTVEDCQADYPGSNIHYGFTDQLSRRYGLPVMGWSWWWPEADRSNDPLEFGRALARAMGHNCHGLNFWVYTESWAQKPAARAAAAHWHRVFQAHWDFLKHATVPQPQVAVVFPRNTGNMYPEWEYPKLDYGWTIAALTEAHVPYEVVSDNQVECEPGVLDDYKALLIPSATWESPRFRAAVERFLARGGYVFTDGDSLLLDNATGRAVPFLTRHFAIAPKKKHKGLFAPTYDNLAEHDWAREHAKPWQSPKWTGAPREPGSTCIPLSVGDEDLKRLRDALPKTSGTGLPNHLLDPRRPHWIAGGSASRHRAFHDIITGDPQPGGTALATYNGEVCAVETAQTVWTGFRPGFDHACIFPLPLMHKWGEPAWPFDVGLSADAEGRAAAREWITRIVKKAGIEPRLHVSLAGKPAPHIEVLCRTDSAGNALLFLINHEAKGGLYRVSGDLLSGAAALCELRTGAWLTKAADGHVTLNIPACDVALLAAGTREFATARLAAHKAIKPDVKPMPVSEKPETAR